MGAAGGDASRIILLASALEIQHLYIWISLSATIIDASPGDVHGLGSVWFNCGITLTVIWAQLDFEGTG